MDGYIMGFWTKETKTKVTASTPVYVKVGKADFMVTLTNGETFTKQVTGTAYRSDKDPSQINIYPVKHRFYDYSFHHERNVFDNIIINENHILKSGFINIDDDYMIEVK